MASDRASILVVDDNADNRDLLARRLSRSGHDVVMAENGRQAIQRMGEQSFDMVLLDIMMPVMSGYEVLEAIKAEPVLRHLPVVVISALTELDSVVRCIKLGAEDYLFKPFDPVLLQARVDACLEKKRLRDQEQAYLAQIEEEREKSERLLLNILPEPIAKRLKEEKGTIADSFPEATILFADINDYSTVAKELSPAQTVKLTDDIFSAFDCLCEAHGVEKIKTIGDAYMAAGGIPLPQSNHAQAIVELALSMQREIANFNPETATPLSLRIGVNSGPVIAGVIGKSRLIYDLWGETVSTASAMEFHGLPGCIQVTEATYALLRDDYMFDERGSFYVKGKGEVTTFLLTGKKGM